MSKKGSVGLLLACALTALTVAACNGSASDNFGSASDSAGAANSGESANASSGSSSGNYGPGAGAGTGGGPVRTGRAIIDGALQTILVDAEGRTLNYSDADTAQHITCTGTRLNLWHPLQTTAKQVQSPPGVKGTLSVVNGSTGLQVTYNGHPLYIYSRDTGPRQVTGNMLNNQWHVAVPQSS
jgi:predicted lipoprotein with Yx(FWY)xxD motif